MQGIHYRPTTILLILRGIAQGVPTAQLARELRSHLFDLNASPNEAATFVDELKARRATRLVDVMLGEAGAGRRRATPD